MNKNRNNPIAKDYKKGSFWFSSTLFMMVTALVVGLFVSTPAWAKKAEVQYNWAQLIPNMGADGKQSNYQASILVRAIITQKKEVKCPKITVTREGQSGPFIDTKMQERKSYLTKGKFDEIAVCEYTLSSAATNGGVSVQVKGGTPITVSDISKEIPLEQMVVFGDTGCRNDGKKQKKCHPDGKTTTDHWPFPKLTQHAANNLSDLTPILVYQGDFRLYDPTGGELWKQKKSKPEGGWEFEVFNPLQESGLLNKGLWIMLRGNHENCTGQPGKDGETGESWLYFFGQSDQGSSGKKTRCKTLSSPGVLPPYALDFKPGTGDMKSIRMIFVDAAHKVLEEKVTKKNEKEYIKYADKLIDHYTKMFDKEVKKFITDANDKHLWWVSHMALFSLNGSTPTYKTHYLWDAMQKSDLVKKKLLSKVSMAFGSHLHQFQIVNSNAKGVSVQRPIQYVIGNSGVTLSGGDLGQKDAEVRTATWQSKPKDYLAGKPNKSEEWYVGRRVSYGYLDATVSNHNKITFNSIFVEEANNKDEIGNCIAVEDQNKTLQVTCSKIPATF